MNKLSLLTIILTIGSISGLSSDYNGYPGLREYYEKYKNSLEVDNLQMGIMQEAKSKIENDYSSEIPSNSEDTNLASHLTYGSENTDDSKSKYPSYGTEDYESHSSQDLPQSGDMYPTQSTNEDAVNTTTSEDPNYGENEHSNATHAPSDWLSDSLEKIADENNETNTNAILHVEAVGDNQNNQSTVFGEYQESPSVEYQEDLNNTAEESNPLPATELDQVNHNLTTVYHVSSTEVNETEGEDEHQFDNTEFMEQRYLEEENEFETVLEDTEGDKNNVSYSKESEEFPNSYHTEADSNQTERYPEELDYESTTASEYILSQTVVESGYDTGNEEQTTKSKEIDEEATYANQVSDEEDVSQQTNLATESNDEEDYYEDEDDDYEEEDDDDDYEDSEDDNEETGEGTNSYQDSTWKNDEAFTKNEDFEDTIEQLEKDAEELREIVLKSLTTEIPVAPRYRSSIVPMLLLSILVVGMLFFCTRAPAYCYNLFRIVRGADGFPFRRSLEKKGYMVLPMGDKSV